MQALSLLLLWLLVAIPAAAGNIYRWTDANGVVHYSDQPQRGAAAVPVQAGRHTSKSSPLPVQTQESRAERVAAIRAEQCEKARKRLTLLQESGRVASVNEDGEEAALGADERVQAILRAQQDVVGLCQ